MISLAEVPVSAMLSSVASRQSIARLCPAAKAEAGGQKKPRWTSASLLAGLHVTGKKGRGGQEVTCLITDSRRVVPGALFFAIGGLRTDGNLFVEEAIDRGAVAVVSEQDFGARFPIDFYQVPDVRRTLAEAARRFYERPDEKLRLTGVTGTNGKTTVTLLTQHLLGGNETVGLIGTIRYDLGRRTLPSFRTTPESVDIHALLSQMLANGCGEAVLEVSSHGIDQKRVHGISFPTVAFLNLTQDHIDYHASMEEYYGVKRRLFTGEVGARPETAVINIDSGYGRRLLGELPEGVDPVTFGMNAEAGIRAEAIRPFPDRTEFTLVWPEGRADVVSPLLGRYNVSNVLAALAIGHAGGRSIADLFPLLVSFPGVPGRMERVECGQPFNVLIDYAHTDDALRHACGMLREITSQRLLVVFGCGGNRDRTKRAPMLEVVREAADLVFVTSDNPRSEPVERIFSDMRRGADAEAAEPEVRFIADRKKAISHALDEARPGDCVLIAGKGHETYQEFDGAVVPFDDRRVAEELIELKNLGGKENGPRASGEESP